MSDSNEVKPKKKRKTKLDKVIDQYEAEIETMENELKVKKGVVIRLREQA